MSDALKLAEPVAWLSWNEEDGYGYWESRSDAELYSAGDYAPQPLYTHPKDAVLQKAVGDVLEAWYTPGWEKASYTVMETLWDIYNTGIEKTTTPGQRDTALREAAQEALDALVYHREQTRPIDRTDAAVERLRTALEKGHE